MSGQDPVLEAIEVDYDPFAEAEVAQVVPTTDAQREVWLADRYGREASLAFNESVSLDFEGALDHEALQWALGELSGRHESLRASFSGDGASLFVAARATLRAEPLDLCALADTAREQALAALRRDAVETPFDLERGPLVRASLVKLGAARHELILTAHHIVCDGWSFGVLSRELMRLYHARSAQSSAALPPADSFARYAVGDAEQESLADADERYWVSCFDRSAPALDLPTDRPRPAQRSFASRREDFVLEPALVESLRRLGAAQGTSLFATLFGVFGGLLGSLGETAEVVIGVPAAGQAARGMPALVGHCVNLLPVRLAIDTGAPVTALLAQARERILDAWEHQACTYGRLLSRLQLPRLAGRLPLVSVQFNLDAAIAAEELSGPGLAVGLRGNPRTHENFELFVNASQTGKGIVLECQYGTELFDAATIRGWLSLFRTALERAVADPAQPVSALYRATADDLALIARFNATAAAFPRAARIEELVAAQAARTPSAVAVVAGATQLAYAELERRANALAAALLRAGAGPGRLVGLAAARNEHLLVGMLGILKTGAGYVPLDPAFPAERLAYMRADAGLAWVVTDGSTADPALLGEALAIRADQDLPEAACPAPPGDAGATAYVIYTSGSTGKPKGVVVPHRAVVNFLASMAAVPGLRPGDRLVAVTTVSFDIAVLELLLPLTVGARVVIADRDTVLDGAALGRFIDRHAATVMQATPSGWRLLLDADWPGRPGFRALVGGEPLPQALAQELLGRVGELWNLYGPTETTIWSSCWRVTDTRAGIRIGTPIANTTIQVLDAHMHPCPVGVPGEICIGGEGLASGYLNRPDLTAERFVADPANPAARLYRTGDRGRLGHDGQLEHLGRTDQQIKLRGYRIELGEIESHLLAARDVARAVVVLREDRPGDARLVAYVVMRDPGGDPATLRERLRAQLRAELPEYMLPQRIEFLAAIPLLPNGKLDRRALPLPEDGVTAQAAVQPADELEREVRDAMQAILSVSGLGMSDDFFQLGGHSLLASRLIARLNKTHAVALPLRIAFEAPTAAGLAAAVRAAREQQGNRRPPLVRAADAGSGPLTLMQDRIRFMEEMYPGRVVYNTPSAHRLRGALDPQAFAAAFAMLLQRQPVLRTAIVNDGAGSVQRVVARLDWTLPCEDLAALPEASRDAELMRRMQAVIDTPIPLDRAPLFRAVLYRLADEEWAFLFMPHHIIWDGWSFDLLYQELAALYPAAAAGQADPLPPLPVSYVDYARWHADWLAGEECRAQLAHWEQRIAGSESPRPLPTDFQRSAGMSGTGGVEWIRIDRARTERLRQVALDCGATLNMLVMAVYAAMLTEATGSAALTLGIPVRGRLAAEVEPVMGFFNNLLPLPLRVEPGRTLRVLVAEARRQLLEALANQDVPFELLVAQPAIAGHAGRAGLYQSLFSFQDARERPRRWGSLEHASILVMQKGATEDFSLWLMEVPDGLEGAINYNAGLFSAATAAIFRARLLGLLGRVAECIDRPAGEWLAEPGSDTTAFRAWVQAHRTEARAGEADATRPTTRALDAQETRLAELWASLLGIDPAQITAADNFFDLGGNSLLVMQAVGVTETQWGQAIDPRRYVYESLGQISRGLQAHPPAGTGEASPDRGAARARGPLARLMSRWRGRAGA